MLAETQLKPIHSEPSLPVTLPESQAYEEKLPTMYDLPCESPEDGMPNLYHVIQVRLLSETFIPATYPWNQVLTANSLYIYYDVKNTSRYKCPDWFAVLGVHRETRVQDLRLSYVIWQEKVSPYVVVELLSPGSEPEDLGMAIKYGHLPTKRDVYEHFLKVPYYLVYDSYKEELQAYHLQEGQYQRLEVTGQGVWLPRAQLGLGVWEGKYDEAEGLWLRCYDAQGNWIPSKEERTEQERRETEKIQCEIDKIQRETEKIQCEIDKIQRETEKIQCEIDKIQREIDKVQCETEKVASPLVEQEQPEKEVALQQLNQMRAQLRALGIEPKI